LKKKIIVLIVFTTLFFVSCSGPSSLYNFDSELTSETVSSQTTTLKVNVPKGWFSALDNKDGKIDLWLIKDDYSASISFIRVNPDKETIKEVNKAGLQKIKEYSQLNNKLAHRTSYIDLFKTENFDINGRKFTSYQFAGSNNVYRVVVFSYKDQYYECTASIKPGQTKDAQTEIYSIQNSVLQSIK
jgi:hypothetical protein